MKKRAIANGRPDTTADDIHTFLNRLDECWLSLEFERKREILRTYAPDGLVLDHGVLRGKVCGFPLAVKVEVGKRGGEPLKMGGFYTTYEAAERLGVSRQYIDLMIRQGKLPVERRQTGKLLKKFIPCEAVDTMVRYKG